MKSHIHRIVAATVICIGAAVSQQALAITVSETTDFSGSLSFTSGVNIGTLDLGSNFVSGSLAGDCLDEGFGIDCNPGAGTGDNQDSFLLDVASGTRITGIFVTTSNVSGPAGLGGTFAFQDTVSPADLLAGLSLGSTTGNLVTTPFDAATWGSGIFGGSASAEGTYSFDYSIEYVVEAVPVPAAIWLFGSGLLGLIGISRRKKAA